MSQLKKLVASKFALALVLPLTAGAAFAAAPEGGASAAQDPASTPATLDTNNDGKADAWDRDSNGTADAWDKNGDGKPDKFDDDGDGKPDKSR
jgi:hypothetical protein